MTTNQNADWAAWTAELADCIPGLEVKPITLPGLEAPLPPAPAPIPAAPTRHGICWACGSNNAPRRRPGGGPTYCRSCWASGQAQPWLNCTICGAARKRTKPGEKHFTCRHHQRSTP